MVNSSDLGGADDKNDYSEIFSVIDVLDGSDDTGVTQLYAMNVVTGLTANKQGDTHRVFPGAFLSAMASNFSITYQWMDFNCRSRNIECVYPGYGY